MGVEQSVSILSFLITRNEAIRKIAKRRLLSSSLAPPLSQAQYKSSGGRRGGGGGMGNYSNTSLINNQEHGIGRKKSSRGNLRILHPFLL